MLKHFRILGFFIYTYNYTWIHCTYVHTYKHISSYSHKDTKITVHAFVKGTVHKIILIFNKQQNITYSIYQLITNIECLTRLEIKHFKINEQY